MPWATAGGVVLIIAGALLLGYPFGLMYYQAGHVSWWETRIVGGMLQVHGDTGFVSHLLHVPIWPTALGASLFAAGFVLLVMSNREPRRA